MDKTWFLIASPKHPSGVVVGTGDLGLESGVAKLLLIVPSRNILQMFSYETLGQTIFNTNTISGLTELPIWLPERFPQNLL